MANRQLTTDERNTKFNPLLAKVQCELRVLSAGDKALLWALRRKLCITLSNLERGKPTKRKQLKKRKRKEQGNKCAICRRTLAAVGPVLDRREAMLGYTIANTRLLCRTCDMGTQPEQRRRACPAVTPSTK